MLCVRCGKDAVARVVLDSAEGEQDYQLCEGCQTTLEHWLEPAEGPPTSRTADAKEAESDAVDVPSNGHTFPEIRPYYKDGFLLTVTFESEDEGHYDIIDGKEFCGRGNFVHVYDPAGGRTLQCQTRDLHANPKIRALAGGKLGAAISNGALNWELKDGSRDLN